MDQSLNQPPELMTPPTRNLLATSATFETDLPNSVQNPYYSLGILSQLGELTRRALQDHLIQKPAPVTPPSQKPTGTGPLATRRSRQPDTGMVKVIEALQALRNTGRSFRRTPSQCTTILKASPK